MKQLIATLLRDAQISDQEKLAFAHVLSKKQPQRSEAVGLLAYISLRALGVAWQRAVFVFDQIAKLQMLNDPAQRHHVSELFTWDGATELWPLPSDFLFTSHTEMCGALMLIPVAGFDRNIEARLRTVDAASSSALN